MVSPLQYPKSYIIPTALLCLECGIPVVLPPMALKNTPSTGLSIMQLFSLLFKCKIYHHLIIILELSNQFWDFCLCTHYNIIFFKLIRSMLLWESFFHIEIAKITSRLPFFPVLVLTIFPHFQKIVYWGIFIKTT